MRIARFLAASGVASRRKSETLITAGHVTVNERRITSPAVDVDENKDVVRYKGERVSPDPPVYLKLYKPPGYTCTNKDPHASKLVTALFPVEYGRLFSAGRLDRESEGVLICTNDGAFADKVVHPRYNVPKTYEVWVEGTPGREELSKIISGVQDEGEILVAEDVILAEKFAGGAKLRFVLKEGKKREIRRICAGFGWKVTRLLRTMIGPIELGDMKPGEWRKLAYEDVRVFTNETYRVE